VSAFGGIGQTKGHPAEIVNRHGILLFSPERVRNFRPYVRNAMNNHHRQNTPYSLPQASKEQPGEEIRTPRS
jgi:hypothetical protein